MSVLPESNLALEVRGATKRFDTRGIRIPLPWSKKKGDDKQVVAVDDLSLTVERGQIFGIVGSNGCGKSTLVRIISTLLYPDGGTISVFGHDVVEESETVRRLINRVSVEASFFRKLSPLENLMFSGQTYGLDRETTAARTFEILGRLGIDEEQVLRPLEQMSRGMQQKVAVARGFLTSPIVLPLDEPTTGLDPASKRQVQKFIAELHAEHDATVLLVTHDMAEAEKLCDQISIMAGGKIVASGTLSGLVEQAGLEGGRHGLEDVFLHVVGHAFDEEPEDKKAGAAASDQ
ncbi:MAG: ABC transporter ATP-binding protein [Chloroflexota bacterium]|nr:ABC transporter ATP-binding protein [Chloroflexota bacterium]